MDQAAVVYFSSINPLSRKIIKETTLVQELFGDKWEQIDEKRQDDIIDDYFVRPEIREKYQNYEKTFSYPASYPVLKVQMGEKIVVDETNDFWTWQDEFSGPFSWKSKSQQDLTLLDLEPEQMTKQSKTRRRNSKDLSQEENRKAPREFSVQDSGKSLWNSDFKKLMKNEVSKSAFVETNPSHAEVSSGKSGSVRMDSSPEEINYAFKRDSFIDSYNNKKKENGIDNSSKGIIKDLTASNGSVTKRKHDIEMSVFENPMISQVVEEEENLSSATTSPSHQPLLKGHNSSYPSPSRKPLLKEDSQESSVSGKSQSHEQPLKNIDQGSTSDKSHLVSAVEYEDTELIAVDVNQGTHTLNDSYGSMSSLNLPKTGFDFLDQW